MAKIVFGDTSSGYNINVINQNFQKIAEELQNKVLYRNNPSGEPNALENDLDANGYTVYNLKTPTEANQAVPKSYVDNYASIAVADLTDLLMPLVDQAEIYKNQAGASATQAAFSEQAAALSASQASSFATTASNAAITAQYWSDISEGWSNVAKDWADTAESWSEASEFSANVAASHATDASIYSSMGLGGAVAFDFGSVADPMIIFPTDFGSLS